mmetsp:Transcript_46794/g.110367  ORF Transcript_46794/g.110367 Transcript_46794/m.110367 type:complete len:202 (+) Transcript_46794:380-985(+)
MSHCFSRGVAVPLCPLDFHHACFCHLLHLPMRDLERHHLPVQRVVLPVGDLKLAFLRVKRILYGFFAIICLICDLLVLGRLESNIVELLRDASHHLLRSELLLLASDFLDPLDHACLDAIGGSAHPRYLSPVLTGCVSPRMFERLLRDDKLNFLGELLVVVWFVALSVFMPHRLLPEEKLEDVHPFVERLAVRNLSPRHWW